MLHPEVGQGAPPQVLHPRDGRQLATHRALRSTPWRHRQERRPHTEDFFARWLLHREGYRWRNYLLHREALPQTTFATLLNRIFPEFWQFDLHLVRKGCVWQFYLSF